MNARSLRLILISGLTAFATGAMAQGDNCATAVAVTPGTYVGDGPATGAGHDGTCNGVGSATNADWYIYTPAADGTVDVYSCLGGTDTRLSVFGGTCGSLTCLGQADDSCPMTIGGAGFASAVYGVGATAGTPIYVMWDDFWTTAGYTWHLDFHCANAPQATTDVVLDCAGGSFYIEVTITGMGSAVTVDITNDGGAPTVSGVGLGTYLIGPFTLGSSVQYVVVNNDDPGCDYFSSAITNFPCPIVSCGPDNYTYCYGNGENTYFVYQATTTDPLALQFNAGGIYAFGGDLITVYDGLNGFAPVLYSGNNGGDLTGLFFVSTNPDHALTLQVTSDGFTSCGDFSISPPWDYTVGCLNCTPPTATYDVIEDCANMVYYVDVSVSSLGSDPDLEITNDGGAPTVVITTPGTYTVGPFPAGSDVTITLVNDANALCNIHSAVLTNIPCPIISCGPDNYTYCYQNNENQYWVYQSASTDPIAMLFNAGGMYPFGGDYISVYNGLDITAPLLYFGNNGGDLSGLFFASSNVDNALSLQITSDAFTSCGDFGVSPPWDYTVACLNCTAPLATFTVVMDCANLVFYIEVNITTLGSDPSLDIINDGGAPPLTASTTGTYTTGPYPLDTDVTVTLVNDANSLCNLESPVLTNTIICPVPVICGDPPLNNTYCYVDYDNHGWHWVSSDGTSPLALIFNAGTIESSFYDHLTIYDGPDAFSPVLYDHVDFGVEDLTGLLVVSTGPDLFMQMSSDGSVCCFTGFIQQWDWDVACLDCSVPVSTFSVVPDCIHREFSVQLDLTSTGSATVADVINTLNTDTVQNLPVGVHMIGPFPMDSTVFLTVLNGDNPLCRQNSPALAYFADSCVIVSCGVDNYTYCYENNDDAWFVYQADGAFPITVTFLEGDMLVNDKIVFYNGPDDFSALIYQGNNGGDLTGVAYSSSNADNILALRVLSDPTGSCSDGGAQQPFQWFVSCGLVGVDELTPGDFLIYPNPTNGLLEIQLGQAAAGTIQLQVADMTGRVVIDQPTVLHNGTNAQVDLGGLQNGNYVVQLITDQWVKAHQVTLAR